MELLPDRSRAWLPRATDLPGVLLATLAFWVLGYAGLRYGALQHPYVSPVWPFAGLALALILVHGYRFWPAILVGTLAVDLHAGASWAAAGGIALVNVLITILVVFLLKRFADFQVQLLRLRDIVNLILFGALLARAIGAMLAVGVLWLCGMVPAGEFGMLWLNRWIGGVVGVLVVTPFLLAFTEPVGRSRGAKWYAEGLLLLVVLAAVSAFVFTQLMPLSYAYYPLAFAPLPLVIWAAIRFELRGAAVASLLLAAVSLLGTLDGHGPFAPFPRHEALLLLAVFNGIVAATGMVVAGAVAQMRHERSLRMGLELLRQVLELLPVGVWMTDPHGRIVQTNPAGRKLWGGERLVGPAEYGLFKGWRVANRTPMAARDWPLARAVESGETSLGEQVEIEGFDGERRVIRSSAMPLRNPDRTVIGAIAVQEDITDLVRGEQQLRELATAVEQTDDIVYVTDRSGIIEYVNASFVRSTGFSSDEAIGGTPAIFKSGEHDQVFYKELWSTILSGAAFRQVLCNRTKAGELYYEAKTISPIRDFHGEITKFVSTGKDITERVRAEKHIARLARARGVMAECNRVLVHATDEMEMLEDMCRIVVESGGHHMAWIGYAEHDEAKSVRPVAQAGLFAGSVEAARISWADTERGRGPTGTAIRTGQVRYVSDTLADLSFAPWRERALRHGFRSVLALPLRNGHGCIGALNIHAAGPDAFDAEEIELLEELAGDIAYGIDALRTRAQRERGEQALRESEELFRQMATNTPEIFWVRELENESVLYISPSWQAVTGWPPPTDRQGMLDIVHAHDYRRVLMEVGRTPEGGFDDEYRIMHADGSIRWLHSRTFPIRDEGGRVYRVAGMSEDITEQKKAEERLLQLAHYDSLTNLPNRSLFFESLKRMVAQAQENQWTIGVLFIDLDRFKVVNDTLGHATGDELLQQVAARLLECVRIRDVVGRLGGDEFALILPALDSPDDAAEVAAKVIQAFAEPFDLAGHETFISASIGITVYPGDANDAEALLRYADTAMYRAKEGGRNTYRYYTAEMNERAMEKLELETALRRALERREFLLHFQPKLDLASGNVSGVEALLRWQRPEVGLVSPADFIPLLEETGLIVPVGAWVIRAACRQINAWEQEGVAPVPIAINLSGRQFHEKTLAALIAQIAREHGVDPRLLEFEITEGSVMANAEETVRILEALRAAGISISVDDFGTGYSSLAYLKRFPIDAVKIDRSFVNDIVTDPDDAAIVLAVIRMAHAMELKVIAEGVETEAQLQFLQANACDEIQGYFFCRPLAGAGVTAFLRERRRTISR
ncbi:MAG: hypothetical protein A3F75_09880 [Betaproteobacteria bacterium RIFCSPLOWO2_12_FULL_64_23]|nr:MAG: hypothetical protein A3F75_09880 [Betaproteobacteria bacterium RIFCSPLOWO2_12_FULL_64_23]